MILTSNSELTASLRKHYTSFELDVQFVARPGITILFGPSGAGKSSILNCLAGFAVPDDGRIVLAREILFDSAARISVAPSRRAVGFVFQDLALFPHLSVQENVEYGLHRLRTAERHKKCGAVLERLRIADLATRRPREISGGERQRVALARTLVTEPKVLLLDEPLAALDAPTKGRIVDDLRAWNETHGIPILYVTHSREEVFSLGEQVLVVDQGRIVACGAPHEVLSAPRVETVAQLAGFENILDVRVDSIHAERGTMTCRTCMGGILLETPLVRADIGARLRIGIRAGDILLATRAPEGLSARNVLPGRVKSLEQRDVIVMARVNCGAEFNVQLTLAARDALQLTPGREVWLVVKTHSCHLMTG